MTVPKKTYHILHKILWSQLSTTVDIWQYQVIYIVGYWEHSTMKFQVTKRFPNGVAARKS